MLNLKDVTGVESSPISKLFLENSLGSNNLKDSRAYSNYEFLLSTIKSGTFKAPSIIFASGDGTFFPKATAYQTDFYSANVLARDGYTNSWIVTYGKNENYNLTYYDGSSLFKCLSVNPSNGIGKIRSIEVRNGNLPTEIGFVQLLLGYNESASTDDSGKYRHNFRTRHSTTDNSENAIDLFLWNKDTDSSGAIGSRRVLSLYGTGSLEVVSGSQIFGPVSIQINTSAEKLIEQNTLAQSGKGVVYYNEDKNRFRYSENGGPFKYLGSSSTDELNYTANASLVYYGKNVENTVYYKNAEPPSGSPTYRTPTGEPTFYLLDGDYLLLSGSGVEIIYDVDGYITSPVDSGTGLSSIYDSDHIRIDRKVVSEEIFYSDTEGLISCSEPVKDVDGFPSTPEYSNPLDNNEITNEIYDVFNVRVLRRKVTDIDYSKVVALSVTFDVMDEWVDGTIKEFNFRSLGKPIFLINSSVYYGNWNVVGGVVSEFKAAPGILIFEAGTEETDGFIFIHSYLDNHITNNDSLQIVNRSYNVKIEVIREGLKLKLINAEYRIPYVFMNSDNTILTEGEFTFKTSTYSKYSMNTIQYLNAAYKNSADIFMTGESDYKTIKISIGTEWPPGVSSSPCTGWENLFEYDSTGESKIHMSIKTHDNITHVTP